MMRLPGPYRVSTHHARAFTLVEVVVSISVISIIMLAMGSAVVLAMRALPDPERPAYKVNQSGQVADQIVAELQESRQIVERTSSAVTFTVADRNGDGSPEQIRYAWSESAGEPLTRQYNQGSVVNVLEDVHEFDLSLDIQTVTEEYPGPPIDSNELIFSQYTAVGDSNFVVNSPDWIGQHFHPGDFLPAEALAWTITKVGFVARVEGSPNGEVYVQLRPATGDNKPAAEVLESHAMNEDVLSET
ncbi:MAG: prepilin-type N-terminal cleavage/methylation domain-containing protein, partial [Planctomycetota bacterium]